MKNTLLSEWITNLFRADIYIILSFRNEESFNISFYYGEEKMRRNVRNKFLFVKINPVNKKSN